MQRAMCLILTLVLLSSGRQPKDDEKVIFDRIEYIQELKQWIDQKVWKGLTDKEYDLPLIYYSDRFCYVANPTPKFIASAKPKLLFEKGALKMYRTALLDSTPFHMQTTVRFGDTSSDYDYKSPFMRCSSFEITQQAVHDVNATEQWTTMIMHEYFHGFQLKHPAFLTHFEKNIALSSDTLHKIYKAHGWFKESVDKENAILLAAIDGADDAKMKSLVDSLFRFRKQRRQQTKLQLKVDIAQLEQIYETMEGTARYVEYNLYSHFARKPPNRNLLKSDTAYHSYQYFRDYNIEKDKWLYQSDRTKYFYATGFNMVRLFEKLKINYKTRLFNEGDRNCLGRQSI